MPSWNGIHAALDLAGGHEHRGVGGAFLDVGLPVPGLARRGEDYGTVGRGDAASGLAIAPNWFKSTAI
jgi:hypothetical protein